MSDSLLVDDPSEWPTEWAPFTVQVGSKAEVLELIASGMLDSWTSGALLRDLELAYDPSHRSILLDLRAVTGSETHAVLAVARCREFATGNGAELVVTPATAQEVN